MGFAKDLVTKAIEKNGERNTELILETLLTYSALNEYPPEFEIPSEINSSESENDIPDVSDNDRCLDHQEDAGHRPDNEKKLIHLIDMDFLVDESSSAIDACGVPDRFYISTRVQKAADSPIRESPRPIQDDVETRPVYYSGCSATVEKRKNLFDAEDRLERKIQIRRRKAKESRNYKRVCIEQEDGIDIPKFMIGFGVPNEPRPIFQRKLPDAAIEPPYFYFENVACTLKGIWSTISRFLYEIEPEFVDLMHFSAAARKRGYVHNLPIHNRYPLQPVPPLTIQEALPVTKKWWPSWDRRQKFNCLRKNKAAPLEPDELEMIMGYPENHTRGGGTSQTDRYKALGNAFQTVVSVEISDGNRNILRSWWEQTNQTGNLIELEDVQQLSAGKLDNLIHSVGGFDLIVGGSP
ncbi:hypothetical protein IFM89_020434 [Coptis chinensis]|uniref:SAM-dependent MTase DRM-type domain-containing protein n=1 Tax=Coptis chinensis TaxID=261450 RepID=A0A835HP17_9MAGN|nr:hypothetical protein IFM89_020434 [Coptis chinensis]